MANVIFLFSPSRIRIWRKNITELLGWDLEDYLEKVLELEYTESVEKVMEEVTESGDNVLME